MSIDSTFQQQQDRTGRISCACTSARMHPRTHDHAHAHTHARTLPHTYACTYACAHKRAQAHTHARMHERGGLTNHSPLKVVLQRPPERPTHVIPVVKRLEEHAVVAVDEKGSVLVLCICTGGQVVCAYVCECSGDSRTACMQEARGTHPRCACWQLESSAHPPGRSLLCTWARSGWRRP